MFQSSWKPRKDQRSYFTRSSKAAVLPAVWTSPASCLWSQTLLRPPLEHTAKITLSILITLIWKSTASVTAPKLSFRKSLPCFTLREVMVLTNEDMIIDSSSGHTDRFFGVKQKEGWLNKCDRINKWMNQSPVTSEGWWMVTQLSNTMF